MTHNEFKVLQYIRCKEEFTQRECAGELQLSLGSINTLLKGLREQGVLDATNHITDLGIRALEPYKVDNAIIMAAGMSSRFAPLSFERPKGLLKVKGDILIERQIKQLQEAGITDITIVVGYMKEMFFYLADKYSVEIVINEDYYKFNNPSTLIRVKDKLKNTYICSSDNYFKDNVFEPYVYNAYYAAKYAEGITDEYCMSLDSHDRIKKVTIGGEKQWYMLGHVYFSKEFSDKFLTILEKEYEDEASRKLLWEQLYMKHIKELDMYIRRYQDDEIYEFDSLDELRSFDSHYITNADSQILKNICKVFDCKEQDIHDIVPIKQGLTNLSFCFVLNDKKYVYRHPGVGTEEYINRKSEAYSMKIAKELNLDDTYLYMEEKEGWKISTYIDDVHNLDYHNQEEVHVALGMMRKLHRYPKQSVYEFDIWKEIEQFIRSIRKYGRDEFDDFAQLYEQIKKIYKYVQQDNVPLCVCHCDCYSPNFMIDPKGKMYLIDWEYSGNADFGVDLGTFICCSDYSYEEALQILRLYFENPNLSEMDMRHVLGYVAITSFYWYVWAIYQECKGSVVGEYLMIWYKYSKLYARKALDLYEL